MLQCAIIIHGYFLISLMCYVLHISMFAVVEPWLDDLYSAIGKEMKQQKLNPIQEGANNVALNGATPESEKNIANLVNKVDTLHLGTIGINDVTVDKSSSKIKDKIR